MSPERLASIVPASDQDVPSERAIWMACDCLRPKQRSPDGGREEAALELSGQLRYMTIYMVRSVTWMRSIWQVPRPI